MNSVIVVLIAMIDMERGMTEGIIMHNDPLTVPDHHVPSLVAGLHLHSKDLVPRRGALRNSQENPGTLPQVEGNLQKRGPVLNIDLKMLCLLIQREKMLGSRLEMMTVFDKALVPITMMIVTTMTGTGPLLTIIETGEMIIMVVGIGMQDLPNAGLLPPHIHHPALHLVVAGMPFMGTLIPNKLE